MAASHSCKAHLRAHPAIVCLCPTGPSSLWTNSAALLTYVSAFGVSVAEPVHSLSIRNRSCNGDSEGGAGGGRSVMATSGMVSFLVFVRLLE